MEGILNLVPRKKEKKTLENTSKTYLSENSVDEIDVEIINTSSLTYFFQLVKTAVKTKVILSKKRELISLVV